NQKPDIRQTDTEIRTENGGNGGDTLKLRGHRGPNKKKKRKRAPTISHLHAPPAAKSLLDERSRFSFAGINGIVVCCARAESSHAPPSRQRSHSIASSKLTRGRYHGVRRQCVANGASQNAREVQDRAGSI